MKYGRHFTYRQLWDAAPGWMDDIYGVQNFAFSFTLLSIFGTFFNTFVFEVRNVFGIGIGLGGLVLLCRLRQEIARIEKHILLTKGDIQ